MVEDFDEGEALLEDREDLEIEADAEELSRAEQVAARNRYIVELREYRDGAGMPLTQAVIVKMIRQYDREHPL